MKIAFELNPQIFLLGMIPKNVNEKHHKQVYADSFNLGKHWEKETFLSVQNWETEVGI